MPPLFRIRTARQRPASLITRDLGKLLKDLSRGSRFRDMEAAVVRHLAEQVHKDVRRKLRGRDLAEYRKALKVGVVTGSKVPAAGVFAIPRQGKLRASDAERIVIYVRDAHGVRPERRKPWADVLMGFSPWTRDTLPAIPKPKEVRLVFRRVTEREVRKVRDQRKADLPGVRRQLVRAGVREPERPTRDQEEIVGVSDLGFTAIRMEFGLGGAARPHWRPAIRSARKKLDRAWKLGKWRRWFWDPNYRGWNRGQKRAKKVPVSKMGMFSAFTKRIQL